MTTSNGGPQVGSSAWLADLQQRTSKLQEDISNSVVTTSSPDQAVTVTVGPNGALHNLSLGHRAAGHTPTQLTTLIMNTVRSAQRKAAERVSEAFIPFGNPELAEHTKKFLSYLPPEDDQDHTTAAEEPDDDKFVPDDLTEQPAERSEPPRSALSAPPPPPVRGRPRRRSPEDDHDDELEPW
jgi:DNA-binding protein YbaB